MAAQHRNNPGWQVLFLLLVLGGLIGGWIGEFLLSLWPSLGILGRVQSVGLPTFVLDLHIFTVSFGFMFHLSIFSILGFILAWLLYRRL